MTAEQRIARLERAVVEQAEINVKVHGLAAFGPATAAIRRDLDSDTRTEKDR